MWFSRSSKFAQETLTEFACLLAHRASMPLHTGMTTKQPAKTPPVASLRSLRIASRQTLEAVAESVSDLLDQKVSRGTLSAIETGARGASIQMLNALAVTYGLEPGDLYTPDYDPRSSRIHRELA